MCTNYMDYGRIIADVYALKKVLHIQILTGNQEDDGPKKVLITPFAWQVGEKEPSTAASREQVNI